MVCSDSRVVGVSTIACSRSISSIDCACLALSPTMLALSFLYVFGVLLDTYCFIVKPCSCSIVCPDLSTTPLPKHRTNNHISMILSSPIVTKPKNLDGMLVSERDLSVMLGARMVLKCYVTKLGFH